MHQRQVLKDFLDMQIRSKQERDLSHRQFQRVQETRVLLIAVFIIIGYSKGLRRACQGGRRGETEESRETACVKTNIAGVTDDGQEKEESRICKC